MSDEPKRRRPHPIRIAVFMLIGTAFGGLFSPAIQGRGPMVWEHVVQMICIVGGALAGAVLEQLVRIGQRD